MIGESWLPFCFRQSDFTILFLRNIVFPSLFVLGCGKSQSPSPSFWCSMCFIALPRKKLTSGCRLVSMYAKMRITAAGDVWTSSSIVHVPSSNTARLEHSRMFALRPGLFVPRAAVPINGLRIASRRQLNGNLGNNEEQDNLNCNMWTGKHMTHLIFGGGVGQQWQDNWICFQ